MFYCKYCNKHLEDTEIHTKYEKSIKCRACVFKYVGIDRTKRFECPCGLKYSLKTFHDHINTIAHKTYFKLN
jgi:hypothetical protein